MRRSSFQRRWYCFSAAMPRSQLRRSNQQRGRIVRTALMPSAQRQMRHDEAARRWRDHAERAQRLDARPAGAEFAHRHVVRQDVTLIAIALVAQHLGVMIEPLARRLVIVDDAHLPPGTLHEPDRGRVVDAEVPPGLDALMPDMPDKGQASALAVRLRSACRNRSRRARRRTSNRIPARSARPACRRALFLDRRSGIASVSSTVSRSQNQSDCARAISNSASP